MSNSKLNRRRYEIKNKDNWWALLKREPRFKKLNWDDEGNFLRYVDKSSKAWNHKKNIIIINNSFKRKHESFL